MDSKGNRGKISSNTSWQTIIGPPRGYKILNIKELMSFRFLIFLFVKRDFQAAYKQTILGPLWFVIQPLLTTGIYSIIFSGIAKIPTDSIPPPLFYLAGQVMWGFFSNILTSNSSILVSNASLFSKVYFPRLAVPIATGVSKLYSFLIQFLLFVIVYFVYLANGAHLQINLYLSLVPIAMIQLAVLGLGFGFIASALTVKYRDLTQLISFGIQLWMYATPIVYPMSFVTNETLRTAIWLNPVAQAVEIFRFGFTGVGQIDAWWMLYSCIFSVFIFIVGLVLFNKAEKTYVDVA